MRLATGFWVLLAGVSTTCCERQSKLDQKVADASSASPGDAGTVSIHLEHAKAQVSEATVLEGETSRVQQVISFDVRLRLTSRERLTVLSNFNTPYSSFDLVVLDERGRELRRVPYAFHLSPYAQDQELTVPRGQTVTHLVFPVEWADAPKTVRVRLRGTFRQAEDHSPKLSPITSNDVRVAIPTH